MSKPVVLVLPYPISANRYWASRVYYDAKTRSSRAMTYVTPEARQYREDVAWIARKAGITHPIDGRVELGWRLYPHRPLDYAARQRKLGERWDDTVGCIDLSNALKVMEDALQGVVLENDKKVWSLSGQRMEPDEHGARLVVVVREIPLLRPQGSLL